ncbi:Alpha-acetolactate decarboxylase [Serratia odorifera]|uniref:Alpha-acetolactate decarboxylase n=1 Tax=Serratia odorifera TaxID=618 RepID=A0A3S4E217_SEROD|nr:Alpha-acetolactate decarboxylase [Serratia odorifera]
MNQNQECACAQHLAQGFARQSASVGEGEIYQISLMSALIGGVYEGDVTIAELLRHGDFGLGTFNHLDGELIAFDREIHQLRADGSARPASPDQKTPFCGGDLFHSERDPTLRPTDQQSPATPVH